VRLAHADRRCARLLGSTRSAAFLPDVVHLRQCRDFQKRKSILRFALVCWMTQDLQPHDSDLDAWVLTHAAVVHLLDQKESPCHCHSWTGSRVGRLVLAVSPCSVQPSCGMHAHASLTNYAKKIESQSGFCISQMVRLKGVRNVLGLMCGGNGMLTKLRLLAAPQRFSISLQ
jgi:hypothetical protein